MNVRQLVSSYFRTLVAILGAGMIVFSETLSMLPVQIPGGWTSWGLGLFMLGVILQMVATQQDIDSRKNLAPKIVLVNLTFSNRQIFSSKYEKPPKFVMLQFANRPANKGVKAVGVSATIQVFNNGDTSLYVPPLAGQWENPDIAAWTSSHGAIDRTEIHVDLLPFGLPARLFTLMKFAEDEIAFILTPDSHEYKDWKHSYNWIPIGKHIMRVTISGENVDPVAHDFNVEVSATNIDVLPVTSLKRPISSSK